jgi:hypothetical protein
MKFVAASLPIAALVIFGLAAPAPARPHPTPTPSPSPTPVPDPAMNRLARQQFVQWQAGTVNKSLYAPQVLEKLSDAKIAQSSQALAQLGPLTDVIYMGRWIDASFPAGARGYFFQMRCLSGNIYLWLALDAQGKIATILFKNRLDIETVAPAPSPSAPPP